MKNNLFTFLSLLVANALLSSCAGIQLPSMEIPLRGYSTSQPEVQNTPVPTQPILPTASATQSGPIIPTTTPTITPLPYPLWIEAAVPDELRNQASEWNVPVTENAAGASLQLGVVDSSTEAGSTWVYALVTAFPTFLDGVTLSQLKSAWNGSPSDLLAGYQIWLTDSTQSAMTVILGEADKGVVEIVTADEIVDALWENQLALGIVPFEALDPKLKVLSIDGQSPVRNNFDESEYPLKVTFLLSGEDASKFEISSTNRDPSKLTVVIMTGVTAMVRALAARMEIRGLDYPAWNIGDTLEAADITHISNEVPFYTGCPYPDSNQEGLVFCSSPKYIELMEIVGTDVVELTGNHFQDYGSVATLQTLEMYDERGWPYFGGGADLEDSRKPALLTHNGNRFAFIGCNPIGPGIAWATEDRPGAAPCGDYEWMKSEIADLLERGYIVIATFQYIEYEGAVPTDQHVSDFREIAEAGATIVSGSQAHQPQAMEFYEDAFIHYGLGNLFFDNMSGPARREFIDRHVFYAGRHISTELVTALLEDYARPRLMIPREREEILEKIFDASGWLSPQGETE